MHSYKDDIDTQVFESLVTKLGDSLNSMDLVIDSRHIGDNAIFCAYPGTTQDGRDYIDDAVLNKGAKVVIYEDGFNFKSDVLHISVKNLISYIGVLASRKYNNPSSKFRSIGITGTNGKTSISYWLAQSYHLLNKKAALIGTTGSGIYPDIRNATLTTPDPINLQKTFATFANDKVDMVALEVSSIGLDQYRLNGTNFHTAIFTNLTQDHLDYHKTMELYYSAKQKLFFWHGLQVAIINIDDDYGKRLVQDLNSDKRAKVKLVTYGVFNQADIMACEIRVTLNGMWFNLHYENQIVKVWLPIIGKFNIYNILAVVASLITDGYLLDEIVPILAKLTPVRGRMDIVSAQGYPMVVVDFAHTPDALRNSLLTLREIEHSGKLYCVFGCGGDRDQLKRPLMGDIAAELSDFVYITSDNPRSEEPEFIINQIKDGIRKNNYQIIVDRATAIKHAITNATVNDIILVAGKGHELYQEIKGIKYKFSDFDVTREVMKKL